MSIIGFPDYTSSDTDGINLKTLDTNHDGFSDRDFFARDGNIIIWRPTNGTRRISQHGCNNAPSILNLDCGYAVIAFQRKPNLSEGSLTVPIQIKGLNPDGTSSTVHDTLTHSYSDCPIFSTDSNYSSKERRLALVIGNGNYKNIPLQNPVNDARGMEAALKRLGFEVIKYENLIQLEMKQAIDDFGEKLKNDHGVGLFFYSGHGVQVNGENYLIPIDANPKSENDAEYDCVNAGRVLGKMEDAGSTTNIMILDACRVNPFERSWTKSPTGKGLAVMMAPTGSLIAYATSPGKVAYDDSEKQNSPYTAALLQYLETPNMSILEMFQKVRSKVIQDTNKKQTPWESTSLTGNFYFRQK